MQTSYKLIFFSLFLFILSLSNEIFALNFPNADKSRELTIEGYKEQEIYSDYKNAIKKYTKALNINPKNLYALLNRAYSRYQIKDTSGAWDDLNRALAIDPNKTSGANWQNHTEEFFKKITPIIEKYVNEKKIDMVLDKKNIFVASKKKNVTQEIIKIIDIEIK